MDLLPKSKSEFSQKEYWDSFFKKRGNKAFEWYGEYPELSTNLHKYIKKQDKILITGCGNSTLGRDLYDLGYKQIINIDISQVVIRQMCQQNDKERSELKYLQMDVLDMSFENEEFNVVFDKGTLDALMPDESDDTKEKIKKYFNQIHRVLKSGGRYICISLLQNHILKILLDYFIVNNYLFRAIRCIEAEKKAEENGESSMPVFMVVCTKFNNLPRKILELNLTSDDKLKRFESADEILEQISNVQQVAFICSGLKQTKIDEEIFFDLYQPDDSKPRFSVVVLDGSLKEGNSQYAAFIVPQGREGEWLFSTPNGRQELSKLTNTNRLAVILLHRDQSYGSLDSVKKELHQVVLDLAPNRLDNKQIPFLSLGNDVGNRTVLVQQHSQHSGDYVVEDVQVDNKRYRRLIYLNSQFVIQSEAQLRKIKSKSGYKEIPDLQALTCNHHVYMSIASLVACSKEKSSSIAVVGLGGGSLCSFLHQILPNSKITGIDIDSDMLKIATEWFGFQQNPNLKAIITDGTKFLNDEAVRANKFNAILFDVDSKDSTVGMSCPPKQFLEDNVLRDVAKLLTKSGLFILNVVLRDKKLRPEILKNLKKYFKTIISYCTESDLNELFFCSVDNITKLNADKEFDEATKVLNNFFKKHKKNEFIVSNFIADLEYLDDKKK